MTADLLVRIQISCDVVFNAVNIYSGVDLLELYIVYELLRVDYSLCVSSSTGKKKETAGNQKMLPYMHQTRIIIR